MTQTAKPFIVGAVATVNGSGHLYGDVRNQKRFSPQTATFRQQPRPEFYVPHWNSAEER